MNEQELKPCPRCKGKLEIVEAGVGRTGLKFYKAECTSDGCMYTTAGFTSRTTIRDIVNTRPIEDALTAENEALKAKVAELGELLNKQLQYNDFMTSNMINALKFENARMREMVRRIDDDAEETIIDSYKRTEKQAHNDLRRFAKAIRQRCEHALKGGEA